MPRMVPIVLDKDDRLLALMPDDHDLISLVSLALRDYGTRRIESAVRVAITPIVVTQGDV